MSNRGLDVLTQTECEEFLASKGFGRIVTKVGDTIAAFPVYYAIVDGDIVFRTDPGTKLAAAVLRIRVTFEVDDETTGYSVMAMGFCEEVRSPEALETAREALEARWPNSERQRIVRIQPDRVTGRRLHAQDVTEGGPR